MTFASNKYTRTYTSTPKTNNKSRKTKKHRRFSFSNKTNKQKHIGRKVTHRRVKRRRRKDIGGSSSSGDRENRPVVISDLKAGDILLCRYNFTLAKVQRCLPAEGVWGKYDHVSIVVPEYLDDNQLYMMEMENEGFSLPTLRHSLSEYQRGGHKVWVRQWDPPLDSKVQQKLAQFAYDCYCNQIKYLAVHKLVGKGVKRFIPYCIGQRMLSGGVNTLSEVVSTLVGSTVEHERLDADDDEEEDIDSSSSSSSLSMAGLPNTRYRRGTDPEIRDLARRQGVDDDEDDDDEEEEDDETSNDPLPEVRVLKHKQVLVEGNKKCTMYELQVKNDTGTYSLRKRYKDFRGLYEKFANEGIIKSDSFPSKPQLYNRDQMCKELDAFMHLCMNSSEKSEKGKAMLLEFVDKLNDSFALHGVKEEICSTIVAKALQHMGLIDDSSINKLSRFFPNDFASSNTDLVNRLISKTCQSKLQPEKIVQL